MSSIARKQRRAMNRAFAATEMGAKGAQALMHIAATEKAIADIQPKIEQDAVMAFTTMVMWVLHNDFGFGNRPGTGPDGKPLGKLSKFYRALARLAGYMKDKKVGITLEDMQQALKDECGLDFLGMKDLPNVLGGPTYGQPKVQ